MFCPKCGARVGDTDTFCPGCGTRLSGASTANSSSTVYTAQPARGTRPVSDVRLVSFLLGLILGLIGLVVALIIYSNSREFEESPTDTVLLWSIFGMFFWVIVIAVIIVMAFGISTTLEIIP